MPARINWKISVLLSVFITVPLVSSAQFHADMEEPDPMATKREYFENMEALDSSVIRANGIKEIKIESNYTEPRYYEINCYSKWVPETDWNFTSVLEFNRDGTLSRTYETVEIKEKYTKGEGGIKTEKKKVRHEFHYNSSNQLSEIKSYKSGVLGVHSGTEFEYNEQGLRSSTKGYTLYIGKKSYHLGRLFYYNENNQLIKEIQYLKDTSFITEIYYYTYNDDGTLMGVKGRNEISRYLYDAAQNLVRISTMDTNRRAISNTVISYDSTNNFRIKKDWSKYDDVYHVYRYDLNNGKLISIETQNDSGDVQAKVDYKYNSKGLRLLKTYKNHTSQQPGYGFDPNVEIKYSYEYW